MLIERRVDNPISDGIAGISDGIAGKRTKSNGPVPVTDCVMRIVICKTRLSFSDSSDGIMNVAEFACGVNCAILFPARFVYAEKRLD